MVIGGSSTVLWDLFASQKVGKIKARLEQKKLNPQRMAEESDAQPSIPLERVSSSTGVQRRGAAAANKNASSSGDGGNTAASPASVSGSGSHHDDGNSQEPRVDTDSHSLPVKWGLLIIAGFFGMSL